MQTIAFLNQKGGVGKTSTCFHLAGTLARQGHRVLLLDADPQASLTQGFWGPETMLAVPEEQTICALFAADEIPRASRLLRPAGLPGITLIPGSVGLTAANMCPRDDWGRRLIGCRDFLREVDGDFDIALIDCPPNLHLCAFAALVASDAIVVPLQAEDFGSQGLKPVQAAIRMVQEQLNPDLRLLGYLLTMIDSRLSVHQAYEHLLRELYKSAVLTTTIPRAKDFVEAVAARQPVVEFRGRSKAAQVIATLAHELLSRLPLVAEVAA